MDENPAVSNITRFKRSGAERSGCHQYGISITLDGYGHLVTGSEEEAAGVLDAYLDAKRGAAEERARAAAPASAGSATSAVNPCVPLRLYRRSFACYPRSAVERQMGTGLWTDRFEAALPRVQM